MSEERTKRGELLAWREQFALGVPAVDHEHRELIKLINETWAGSGVPGASAAPDEEMLGELLSKISAHFALEERMMSEARYDDYGAHKADHEVLLDRLRDIMETAGDQGYTADTLGRDLDAWFVGHFRTHDARLHGRLP